MWCFSRATKFGKITHQDKARVYRGQTQTPKGMGPYWLKIIHTCGLSMPAIVAKATKFGMIKNFRSWTDPL